MPNDELSSITWNNLSSQVKRHIAPFQQILKEHLQAYGSDDDGSPYNLYGFVRHVLWLVPLAELLETCPVLHHMSPRVHHAVIELRPQPHPHQPRVAWVLSAIADGQFRLQQVEHGSDWHQSDGTLLGEGDAARMIQLLTELTAEAT